MSKIYVLDYPHNGVIGDAPFFETEKDAYYFLAKLAKIAGNFLSYPENSFEVVELNSENYHPFLEACRKKHDALRKLASYDNPTSKKA